MNKYILIIILVVILISYYYIYINTTKEGFEAVSTRACTVWFTEYKNECNEGLFHKDLRTIEYLRNDTLSTLDKQIMSIRKKLEDNNYIITNFKGMTVLAIERKIVADAEAYITTEKNRGLERNQLQIELEEQKIRDHKRLARQYFYSIPTLERENIRLNNNLTTLSAQLVNVRRGADYQKLSNVLSIKQKDPNFRCKNEYLGWDEFNSSGNANLKDFEKSSQEVAFRGHPYTWAFCHKNNRTLTDKTLLDTHLENKKYDSVDVYNANISPNTTSVRFNKFDQSDMMECDEKVVSPNFPSIPNGLLEIKLAPNNNIISMRAVRYKEKETRFIDNDMSKNLSDIDLNKLTMLFYDVILSLDKDRYQFYVYPKKTLLYRVHNLYYDNKCKRFFGDTKKPVGVSRSGDLFNRAYPLSLLDKVYRRPEAITKQRMALPSREFMNTTTFDSKILNAILTNMRKSYDDNLKVRNSDEFLLNQAIMLKDYYKWAWSVTPNCVHTRGKCPGRNTCR